MSGPPFDPREEWAREMDAGDPLAGLRARFRIPQDPTTGAERSYLCGNSLGLQPLTSAEHVEAELEAWSRLAVDAHFDADAPWYSYHELFREPGARLVGAQPGEIVMMNSLTVNLHLMLVSFYRPTPERFKILVEHDAFPSDTYAVQSQIRFHGYDPDDALIVVRPREGERCLRTEDVLDRIERRGHEIAVVLFSGVHFFTGQLFDMHSIAARAREQGCVVGFDLAHAAGNVELGLHDWNVDFAVWCSYKYLNAGPGAVAGCFVHERHAQRTELPRFAGWWGNDPERRFRMHLEPEFTPVPGAEGWQLSNPPILALAPLRASLALFDEAGLPTLRAKSRRLTAYLEQWVEQIGREVIERITPADPDARGCQLSLRVRNDPRRTFEALQAAGVVGDYREPGVIRLAPVPLYNSFHDVWRAGSALAAAATATESGETR